jgi:PAP_fibrillin
VILFLGKMFHKKAELLELIAGRNRGLLDNEIERVKVLSLIEQLEDYTPNPEPIKEKDLLEGNWRLLYTTSKGLLGLDRVPLFQLGQIYQCLRISKNRVYNIAEIVGVPFLEGLMAVTATFEIVSSRRVNVKFDRYIIGLQRLFNYRSANKFIEEIETGKKFLPLDFSLDNQNQKAWLDVTYLDSDLRISRGNEGSVFVLSKER